MTEVAVQSLMQEETVVEQPQAWQLEDTNNGGNDDKKSVYYDNSEGMWKCHHCIWTYKNGKTLVDHVHHRSFSHGSRDKILGLMEDINIPKLVNAVVNNQNSENIHKPSSGSKASTSLSAKETNVKINIDDVVEENGDDDDDIEEVELEFERSFEKVHTHTPYCPNCNSQITKVVLRRRIKKRERTVLPPDHVEEDLVGCFSCFRVFKPSGGGVLNPFKIFSQKPKPQTPQVVADPPKKIDDGSTQGDDKGKKPAVIGNDNEEEPTGKLPLSSPRYPLLQGVRRRGDVILDFGDQSGNSGTDDGSSTSVEILRCIIYGGLMELIASLSVVSSAAASDAQTLNILAIGFATVISSIFVFGNNLIDMKNESPKENSTEQAADRYEEHLGKRGNFLLHATFAVLSFLIFGLMPPVVYAFAFRESDNKDNKIIAVAAAAFACVFLLSIGKAYVGRQTKLSEYVKTILYYVTMTASVSGVSYAAGDLAKIVMEKYGWFETTPAASDNVPAWASY